MNDLELRKYVAGKLKRKWSPDQIAERTWKEFPRRPEKRLSSPTIYA